MFYIEKNIDRSHLFSRFSEQEIIARYLANYGLDTIDFAQIRYHAELEGRLTDQILNSSRATRAQVASDAYSALYHDLDWLTETGIEPLGAEWLSLLHPGASVYEVGSGAGRLAHYLNTHGVQCTRTDISSERSSVNNHGQVQVTDGVNLSAFTDEKFDYVISDQVVEHLHPDDLVDHFVEARKILKPGGQYIFCAPNAQLGPRDLSRVFGEPRAIFMHLREFAWRDVSLIVANAGYSRAAAVLRVPGVRHAIKSAAYLRYLIFVEEHWGAKPYFARIAKALLFPSQVWVALCTD